MTVTYPFEWGFSDGGTELGTMPDSVLRLAGALQPDYWRMMTPWSLIASTPLPGPYPGGGRAQVTATATGSGFVGTPTTNGALVTRAAAYGEGRVIGTPGSAAGRDWSYPDRCVNEIRLKAGADVLMIIGQSKPANYTTAQFQSFCAEVVERYKPGGPGIRTDGIYASLAGWGVTHFEIWNEENQNVLWGAAVSAVDYTALLIAGYNGIKSVLPGAASTVLFGGMQHVQYVGPWFGDGYNTLNEYTFLKQCYAAGAQGHFDAMATHVYPYTDVALQGSTVTGGQPPPGQTTTGAITVTAQATGTGALNLTNPSRNGRLQAFATATGTGALNWYEPAGPVPSMAMDNFRQVHGIQALMQANGDGAKGIWITETGYCVYSTGITPALQATYVHSIFDLLATIPAVDVVIVYNAQDSNNGTTDDGVTGYGAITSAGDTRPLYDFLHTLSPLVGTGGGGGSTITATATGTGSIGGTATTVITATAHGSGGVGGSGGIITATATGTGLVGVTAFAVITATALGNGVRAIFGSGGSPGSAGAMTTTARAQGQGRVGITANTNGDLVATADAHGTGMVAESQTTVTRITVEATGSGLVSGGGSETGVVGIIGSGSLTVTATAHGNNATSPVGSGAPVLTATAVGAGVVAGSRTGSLTVTATATGAGSSTNVGTGSLTVTATATGAGVVGKVTGGALTVTATAQGVATGATGNLAATASATSTGAMTVSHTFSGTTYGPFSTANLFGQGVNYSVTGGLATEGNATTSVNPTNGISGTVFLGVPYPVPMGTNLHWASAIAGSNAGAGPPRATGVAIGGSTASFTNGVIVQMANFLGANVVAIYSKVGSSYVMQANANTPAALTGGVVSGQISFNGSNYVYTAYYNGVSVLTWTDTTNVVGTPGLWTSPVWGGFYNGTYFGSMGITAFAASDLGTPGPSTGGTSTVTATATGAGIVGKVTGGAPTDTATATGGGVVAGTRTGSLTVTATATGTGTMAATDGGSLTVTATATGAGLAGDVTGGSQTVTATATGAGLVAASTGGTSTVTATATGAGVVAMSTGGALLVTATGTGSGTGGVAVTRGKPANINTTIPRASTY